MWAQTGDLRNGFGKRPKCMDLAYRKRLLVFQMLNSSVHKIWIQKWSIYWVLVRFGESDTWWGKKIQIEHCWIKKDRFFLQLKMKEKGDSGGEMCANRICEYSVKNCDLGKLCVRLGLCDCWFCFYMRRFRTIGVEWHVAPSSATLKFKVAQGSDRASEKLRLISLRRKIMSYDFLYQFFIVNYVHNY